MEMSEGVNAKRCQGPCGKVKRLDEFPEHRVGERRSVCRECYNARRKGTTHGELGPKPQVREEQLDAITEHRLKQQVREQEARIKALTAQLSDDGEYSDVVREVLAKQREKRPPVIRPLEKKSGLLEGTPLILASDWHVEEEVRPESVAGRNRYNLDIAKQRMQRFFEGAMWAIRQQKDTFKIRTAIGWWGGDFITNFLHDDDAENNQLAPAEALLFAERGIIDGIEYWLKAEPEISWTMPMNDGNHGRPEGTRKLRNAGRTAHSMEVLMYAHIAQHFRNEPRLRFVLPTSQFTFLDDVYGRTIRFIHGDVFKYAGGIGGITVPLFRALGRWEKVKHADLTCMGHWHQRYNLPDVMINGSLIGYNNYAMAGGFGFEPPVQSVRMLDSKRWCSSDIPLWVSKREDDLLSR